MDLLFLRWVWMHASNWGFWDWDYQQTLLEASRRAWVDHGQAPLWNPYIGGGATLAGNTLNHAWAPCFIPVLLFGTLAGVKICLFIYALLGQWGMFLFARQQGMNRTGAFLSAVLFIVGGVFAHRLTHGHFEWIAIAWIPFVLRAIHRNLERLRFRDLALGALFYAFIFLDGGPYQFAFFSVFLGIYVLLLMIGNKSHRPLPAMLIVLILGTSLAAIKLIPVYETVNKYPREVKENNFYGAPFTPKPLGMLHRSFFARDQEHRPNAWMPYNLNVGCYVGWIPVLLAILAMTLGFRKRWLQIICALFFFWIMLGSVLPWSPWNVLSKLPGLSMLRVPSRFNVFVLFWIAFFAGESLGLLCERFKAFRWMPILSAGIVMLVALDLVWVNGEVFKVAFSVPPMEVRKEGEFKSYLESPYMERYRTDALYATFPNWPSAAFPPLLENRGVIANYRTIPFQSHAIPFDHPLYKGEAWISGEGGRIEDLEITPNRISASLNARGTWFFINRNFDEGWKCGGEPPLKVVNRKGLLAVRLEGGRKEIELVYRPDAFYWGALVSGVTVLILLALILIPLRKR
ncbi:MAG: hypothetical protein ACYTG7_05175 [Planctomycetota bacterium]|jgi:hypothetical protein